MRISFELTDQQLDICREAMEIDDVNKFGNFARDELVARCKDIVYHKITGKMESQPHIPPDDAFEYKRLWNLITNCRD